MLQTKIETIWWARKPSYWNPQVKFPPTGLVISTFTLWKNLSTSIGFEPANLWSRGDSLPRDHLTIYFILLLVTFLIMLECNSWFIWKQKYSTVSRTDMKIYGSQKGHQTFIQNGDTCWLSRLKRVWFELTLTMSLTVKGKIIGHNHELRLSKYPWFLHIRPLYRACNWGLLE